MVECSVKDARYVDHIESLFQRNDFLTFTTQTTSDFVKLGDQLYGTMRLGQITIKTCPTTPDRQNTIGEEQMRRFGFDGWAADYLDGPGPVLAMLCSELRLDTTGISLSEGTDAQYSALVNTQLTSWVTGRYSYRVSRRREYGPGATSTATRNIRKAQVWTDQPVDTTAQRELQSNVDGWKEEFAVMKQEKTNMVQELQDLELQKADIAQEHVSQSSMRCSTQS